MSNLEPIEPGGKDIDHAVGGGNLYWLFKNVFIGPGAKQIFRPVVEGESNVPAHGPAIIASNHLSVADWLFTPIALRRRITYAVKSDYFTGTGIKGFAQRRFFAGTGRVPVDVSGGASSQAALRAGLRILRRGELFGIFPEGSRSHDGRLYKGRTDVARLALEARVPVIPTAVLDTDVIAPANKPFGKVVPPIVKFGRPLDFSRYDGMADDRFILRSITDEIMYAIMELSGKEYVDAYAPVAKERAKQEAEAARLAEQERLSAQGAAALIGKPVINGKEARKRARQASRRVKFAAKKQRRDQAKEQAGEQ